MRGKGKNERANEHVGRRYYSADINMFVLVETLLSVHNVSVILEVQWRAFFGLSFYAMKQMINSEYSNKSYSTSLVFSIHSRSEVESLQDEKELTKLYDVFGLVHYVGRTERTRKKGYLKACNTYTLI